MCKRWGSTISLCAGTSTSAASSTASSSSATSAATSAATAAATAAAATRGIRRLYQPPVPEWRPVCGGR